MVVPIGAVAASRNSTSVASANLRFSSSQRAAIAKTSRILRGRPAGVTLSLSKGAPKLRERVYAGERRKDRHVRQRGRHTPRRRLVTGAAGVGVDPRDCRAAPGDVAHRLLQLWDLADIEP